MWLPFLNHLQCARQLAYFISNSVSTLKVGVILQMRKLRLREAKKVAQGRGRKLQTRTGTENSLRACFIFFVCRAAFPQRKTLNTDR